MTRHISAVLVAFALTFPRAGVSAQEESKKPDESDRVEETEETEETADPEEPPASERPTVTTSARAPIPEFSNDRSVHVVDDEELRKRQAKSITDALEEENGILIQQTNRGAGSVFLRGLTGPENLIVFDGVRFNQSTFRTGPNQYLNTIDPWALDRVEVVRGPGSVLYGTGAMGGVIQAFPLRLPTQPMLRVIAAAESAEAGAGGHATTGAPQGPASGLVGATYRRHGRLRIGNNGDLFVAGVGDDNILSAIPYNEVYWQTAAGLRLGDDHLVRANYYGGLVDEAMRIDRIGDGESRIYDNTDHLAYVTWEWDGPRFVDDLRANVSYHRTREEVLRFNCRRASLAGPNGEQLDRVGDLEDCLRRDENVLASKRRNVDTVETVGSSVTGVTRLLESKLRLTWGGDVYVDFVQSARQYAAAPDFEFEPHDRGNFADGSNYSTIGFFTHGEYEVFSTADHAVVGNAGARVENFGAVAPDVTEEIGDVEYNFTGVVGTAGIAYLYRTRVNTYLNWSQGFRAPNLQESTVLGDTGNFFEVPNPDLGPERSDTFELGSKLDFPGVGRLRPAVFVSLISNRITREDTTFEEQSEIDGKQVRHRVNRDTAYYYGAAISGRTASWDGISLYGNLSAIDGAVQADEEDPTFEAGPLHDVLGTAENHENPRRLPPLMFLLGFEYAPADDWYVGFYAQGAGAQNKLSSGDRADQRICEKRLGVLYEEVGEECPGSQSWVTLNARAGYRWEALRFDLALENLTDERYRRHGSGVPGAGFNVLGQLTLRVK